MRRSKNGKQNTCISFKFWPRSTHLFPFLSLQLSTENIETEKKKSWSRSFTSAVASPKKPQLPYAQTYTESQKYLWPEHTKMPNAVYKFVYWHVRSQIVLWYFFFAPVLLLVPMPLLHFDLLHIIYVHNFSVCQPLTLSLSLLVLLYFMPVVVQRFNSYTRKIYINTNACHINSHSRQASMRYSIRTKNFKLHIDFWHCTVHTHT